jgi:hypothetical protein
MGIQSSIVSVLMLDSAAVSAAFLILALKSWHNSS